MMARYLLDTNVISEPLRPKPDPGVLEKLQLYQEELAISAITWHELWFGCLSLPGSDSKTVRKTAIERYLIDVVAPSLPILAYDERAAAWHAGERARLAGVGKTPSFVDGQIAAIACTNDLTLVTSNTAHFLEFKDLRLEDWRSHP